MKTKAFFKSTIQLVFLLMTLTLFAQEKFTTHPVEEGETIYSIAKKYRVTPYAILQENPEIKAVDELQPNTILVIPLNKKASDITTKEEFEQKLEEAQQIEPVEYKRHRVRRKETLFSLTQKYEITEEQLKRYNRQLYAEPLKKGMVLQIPIFPEVDPEEEKELDFQIYTVSPKETRWSVANKFGISIDSLLTLNPELPKNSSYLAEGFELKVPRPKGDSLGEQEVVLYETYVVPKSIGIYRISQQYGIPADSVVRLNPQIVEMGGLKEGMELRLPKKKSDSTAINASNFIFYQVKPKQGIFRLTQELNTSRDSLFLYNPELENGVKAGMILKLPKTKAKRLQVKNSLVIDNFKLIDSIDVNLRPKVVYMLPFLLDRVDYNNAERMQNQVKRRDIGAALGLYTGALVALDSLKSMGVSANVEFVDTKRSKQTVENYFTKSQLWDTQAIVGPVDTKLLNEIAARGMSNNIPVLVPFAASSNLPFENLFFSMPKEEVLRNRILDYVQQILKDQEIIIIADAKHQAAKDSILQKFPSARVAKMSEDGSLHLVDFETMLFENKEHWIFVETEDPNLAASVSSIVNAANSNELYGLRMFTTTDGSAFESSSVEPAHLSNLQFTFPSAHRNVQNDGFTKAYRKKFGYSPDRFAIRGFDLTMDLMLKLAFKKSLFDSAPFIGQTEYSSNRFDYINYLNEGYYNQASFILQYDKLRIVEIKGNDFKSNL